MINNKVGEHFSRTTLFLFFFNLVTVVNEIIHELELRIVLDSISGQRFTFSSNHVSSNLIIPNECLKCLTYCWTRYLFIERPPSHPTSSIQISAISDLFPPPSRWRISFAIAREPSTIPPPFSSSTFAPKLRNYVIKLHPQRVGGAEIELIAANLQNGLAEKLERTHTRSRIPWFHGISICIGEREHRDSIAVFF